MAKFKVLREHLGDRFYVTGDTREADPEDVAHLVARGVLQPFAGKAETPLPNKAETTVVNKAVRVRKARK